MIMIFRRFIPLFICLLVFVAKNLPAQTPSTPRWRGLLFAAEKYDPKSQGLQPLRGCYNDMTAAGNDWFARLPNATVDFLHDRDEAPERQPTKANFDGRLNKIIREAGPNDVIAVLVSAHGIVVKGKSYICPLGAPSSSTAGMIAFSDLVARLKSSKAHRKILIVDACRTTGDDTGDFMNEFAAISKSLFDGNASAPSGLAVISSCSVSQEAHEMMVDGRPRGVFMKYFLEGLSGPADYMGVIDGQITLSEAHAYAFAQTSKYVYWCRDGQQQTPELFRESGLVKFTLARSEPAVKKENETDMQFLLRQSMILAARKQFSLAADVLTHIISREPNNNIAFACRAGTFLSQSKYAQAMDDFSHLGRTLDLYVKVSEADKRPVPQRSNTSRRQTEKPQSPQSPKIRIRAEKRLDAATVSYTTSSDAKPKPGELVPGQKVSIARIEGPWYYVARIDDDASQNGIGWIHFDHLTWSPDNIEQYRPQTSFHTPQAPRQQNGSTVGGLNFRRQVGPAGGGTGRAVMQGMPGMGR